MRFSSKAFENLFMSEATEKNRSSSYLSTNSFRAKTTLEKNPLKTSKIQSRPVSNRIVDTAGISEMSNLLRISRVCLKDLNLWIMDECLKSA